MRIESIEDTLPGIRRAEASYKKGNLSVEFDETVIGEAEIFAAIKKMGYSPQVE
jgi:copper chaperone CopZ